MCCFRTDERPKALTKKTAVQQVYGLIKNRILDGTYEAYSFVREAAVAKELDVSRTPVREALRELISEGWLEAIPHAGARVVAWTENDAREVFEIRLVLEPMAVAAAAKNMNPERLEELKLLATEMEDLVDHVPTDEDARNRIAALNYEFHRKLIESSKNQRLTLLLGNIVPNSVIRRNIGQYNLEHLRRSMQHHTEILQAVAAGNVAWAENIMRTHLLAARELHLHFLKEE